MPESSGLSQGRVREAYAFIKAHRQEYSVQAMCRILEVAPSGYYDWLQQPISNRAKEDGRLLRLIRASFVASQGVYGAPRVFLDLREAGETCSKHRVARLMRENKLRALHGYRVRRWSVGKQRPRRNRRGRRSDGKCSTRDVAQPGSAPDWGSGGRGFESRHPDQIFTLGVDVFWTHRARPASDGLCACLGIPVQLPAPGPSPRAKRLPVETASTLIGWRVNCASPPFAPRSLFLLGITRAPTPGLAS